MWNKYNTIYLINNIKNDGMEHFANIFIPGIPFSRYDAHVSKKFITTYSDYIKLSVWFQFFWNYTLLGSDPNLMDVNIVSKCTSMLMYYFLPFIGTIRVRILISWMKFHNAFHYLFPVQQ